MRDDPGLVKRIPPSAGRSFLRLDERDLCKQRAVKLLDAIRPQGDERGIDAVDVGPEGGHVHAPACIRQWIESLAHTQQHLDRATVVALLDLIVGDPDLQDTSVEIAAGAFIDNPGLFQ